MSARAKIRSRPSTLAMVDIPKKEVEELPGGMFEWGHYRTETGIQSHREGWQILNAQWHEDREVLLNMLLENEQHTNNNQ